ncbi:septum site-determining protein MinC [Wansuia hejianensis]|uniref:septum site-determining protein MinC n=1 Tax=Wansuia hejianensis TaxID=2763667 RepID=UPI0020165156
MKNNILNFKGTKDGVYLNIKGSDFQFINKELDKRINQYLQFYQGAKFLGVKAQDLTEEQILEINLMLKYKHGFDISLEELHQEFKNVFSKYKVDPIEKEEDSSQGEEGLTKFIHGTLRSGQMIKYDGNIVVVGDVNPGAFLKAKGNIIVLGTLRGVAHAGLNGNTKSIVAAYNLLPTQLRIGDIIVRAPDEDVARYKVPEVAKIHNGEVIIEPYLPNK